jgi:hypothetical protein
MFKKLREKLQSQTDARKTFDPSQSGDPNAMETEWSPLQTIYPIDMEPEPTPSQFGDPNVTQTDDSSQSGEPNDMETKWTPSHFGDPIALQTDWEPLESDGASSWTRGMHKWTEIDSSRMEFRTDAKAIGFFIMVVGMLLGAENFFLHKEISNLLFGFVIMVVGGCLLYFGTAYIVFDKYKGVFWKGRKAPDEVSDRKELKYFAKLADIHALQLIDEWCEGRTSYINYQLNLVLKNGSRINVIEDRKQKKIREMAQALSKFLDKPVWDAT